MCTECKRQVVIYVMYIRMLYVCVCVWGDIIFMWCEVGWQYLMYMHANINILILLHVTWSYDASSDVLVCDVVMKYMCCVHVVRVCVHSVCVCTWVRGCACVWSYGDIVICLRHIHKNPTMYVSVHIILPSLCRFFFASRHIGCSSAIDQHHDLSRHNE